MRVPAGMLLLLGGRDMTARMLARRMPPTVRGLFDVELATAGTAT
ncbi:hypothetical protein JD76_01051 [Micromonospora endolithica]|nr:hypothetical protein JD76_01051 [Micromonospora endolithica]